MGLIKIRNRNEREWKSVVIDEIRFINEHGKKSVNPLMEKVPQKARETINMAFSKAFLFAMKNGTTYIEKTYSKDKAMLSFFENDSNEKTMRGFHNRANTAQNVNTLISGTSGVVMGILGIGVPDIALLVAFALRSVYEIAMTYGYEYESETEKYFILMLIRGAMSRGDDLKCVNERINTFIKTGQPPKDYSENFDKFVRDTASVFSEEIMFMKIVQGIPVIGILGGISDIVCLNKITKYAKIKYKRRFLYSKMNYNKPL